MRRKPSRWDLSAEWYSAAVTLYEITLGSGVLPQWGNDKSDPALTDDELVIEAEKSVPAFPIESTGRSRRSLKPG